MSDSCHIWMSHITYEWVMSHMNKSCEIWMSHVTYEQVISHMNESCIFFWTRVSYSIKSYLIRRLIAGLIEGSDDSDVQSIAFGVSFLQSQISIYVLVLYVSFATFRWKETKETESGNQDWITLQTQCAVFMYSHLTHPHVSYRRIFEKV